MGYKHNKEDILAIGYDLLRKNGYHHVGINEVLQASGLPKGSFYNFFKSKEDFAAQVIDNYGLPTKNWIEEYFSNEGTPLALIKSFYKNLIDLNDKDDFSSGCLLNNMSNEIGRTNDNLAQKTDANFESWIKVLSKVIEEGQQLGEIRSDYNAKELAEFLHTGIYGTFARMKVKRSRDFMDKWYDMAMDFISDSR